METMKKMFMSICIALLFVNMFLILAMVGVMTNSYWLFWVCGWAVVGSTAVALGIVGYTLYRLKREQDELYYMTGRRA